MRVVVLLVLDVLQLLENLVLEGDLTECIIRWGDFLSVLLI